MTKNTITPLFLVLSLVFTSSCMKAKSEVSDFQQSYVLQYNQWNTLRRALYQVVIDENLSYMDTSIPYPSGAHTLMIQMGRADQLTVIVIVIKGSDMVNLGIDCEQQCLDWSNVRDKLIAIMQNLPH